MIGDTLFNIVMFGICAYGLYAAEKSATGWTRRTIGAAILLAFAGALR